MSNDTTRDAIGALETLLEREREALLEGDLDLLIDQLDAKTALIERLNDSDDAEAGAVDALQTKVKRNQALLDSALEGIRSVASRMSALHRIRRTLDTYDETGRRTSIESLPDHQLEKRA